MNRKPWATLTCQHCQAKFYVPACRAHVAKFCSKSCYGAANKQKGMVRLYGNTGEMR